MTESTALTLDWPNANELVAQTPSLANRRFEAVRFEDVPALFAAIAKVAHRAGRKVERVEIFIDGLGAEGTCHVAVKPKAPHDLLELPFDYGRSEHLTAHLEALRSEIRMHRFSEHPVTFNVWTDGWYCISSTISSSKPLPRARYPRLISDQELADFGDNEKD